MSRTVRARTMDKAMSFVNSGAKVQGCIPFAPHLSVIKYIQLESPYYIYEPSEISKERIIFTPVKRYSNIYTIFKYLFNPNIINDNKYFDIDHLSRLAQEESYTMPRGLTREQRRKWARRNLSK